MKRLFDIVVSFTVLTLFFPLGIIIGIFIVLGSKGGVFYRQKRVGLYGKDFHVLKFRTMKQNAEQHGKLTVGMKDSRITTVGYFLRKNKLDEFPQFLNVLKGEMSIVGPRPEVREYVDLYTLDQKDILKVKPGITDYASLEYFNENELLGRSQNPQLTYVKEVMPAKIELNRKYLQHPTLREDLKIMWLTFIRILRRS